MIQQKSRALEQWYLTWDEDDLEWGWSEQSSRTQQERAREQRRLARSRRDRRYFGEALITPPDTITQEQSPWWLQNYNLPSLETELALAQWLNIPLTRLRWFSYDHPADTVWHYHKRQIPKRSGGVRTIIAPKEDLKAIQRKLLRELLDCFPTSEPAHGFIKSRSIVSNATPHIGKPFLLNLDLEDFFPSITFERVRGFFQQIYPTAVASALAMLCTEYDREVYTRYGTTYYISTGKRHLVQGAPTSPAIANLLAHRLDARLCGLAEKYNFAYTRYADDLTFSGKDYEGLLRILQAAQHIIEDEGFHVNTRKTQIKRASSRQIVTGVVVNEKLSAPRHLRRRLRAILHQAQSTGLEAQNHDGRANFRAYLNGLIGYIQEINPDQATQFKQMLDSVAD